MHNQEKETRSYKSELRYLTPRQKGTNPRAKGTNPRAKGTNPRALKLQAKKNKKPQKILRTILGTNCE
jgi:hypothetical protein